MIEMTLRLVRNDFRIGQRSLRTTRLQSYKVKTDYNDKVHKWLLGEKGI